jgi:hypothetical protein
VLGQNILYRIAREVIGNYRGSASLNDLKQFFREDQRNHNGIYYNGSKRCVNNDGKGPNFVSGRDQRICDDAGLNDIKNMEKLSEKIQEATGIKEKKSWYNL